MRITYDPEKRDLTLAERGLDMALAAEVFAGPRLTFPDVRRDHGEERIITIGLMSGRMVVLVWVERGAERRIVSLRKANERERTKYAARLE